jgi:glycerophosphoryl diester phosphodiesterase
MPSRPDLPIEIIAHRGFSARAPENTIAAMEAAIEAGADSVEFDLQTAACGTPVVFHDAMLGRTTNGVGPLGRRPLGHLKALDAGSWFGPEFAGETIPSQEEALAHLKDRVQRVYQEVKGYREMEDLDRMADITRNAGMAEASIFISLDWVILDRLQQVAPEISRAYIVETAARLPEAMEKAQAEERSGVAVEIGVALSNPGLIQAGLAGGIDVATWTVNDPTQAANGLELGITRFTTNEVGLLMAWRESLG